MNPALPATSVNSCAIWLLVLRCARVGPASRCARMDAAAKVHSALSIIYSPTVHYTLYGVKKFL